ncbi:MAG: hypothetical protein CMN78_03540 [Spirochaetales bacterium]|nr:hypothetical protein [Spirochaetales bacterium]
MNEQRIPDLYLEQFALGELSDEQKGKISTAEGFQEKLDALRLSSDEILRDYPPSDIASAIEEKLSSEETGDSSGVIEAKSWFTPKRATMLLAAAVFAIIAGVSPVLFRDESVAEDAPVEMTRIKGMEPTITLFRKLSDTVEELIDGSIAQESDLLQIRYNAAGRPYGAIFSVDGRGVVTLHLPSVTDGPTTLERNGDVALEYSYRLDDAPLFERFFFITSDTSFTINTVLNAAKVFASQMVEADSTGMKGSLDLPEELEQKSLTLKKEVSK